jgi:MCP family monocarboxylic acid transporter-like MFS transporter 12
MDKSKKAQIYRVETPPLTPDNNAPSSALFVASSVSLAVKRQKARSKFSILTRVKRQLTRENIYKIMIILGSFIVYFIADGFSLTFGLFSVEFVKHFNRRDDEKSVFLTTALIQAIPLFLSPVVCFLIKKFSCRAVALCGSTLFFLGFILARYAVNSLVELNLVVGFMTSTGLAMLYIPAYLIISFYFNERRALATGIAVSGSGLGMFAFSPLVAYLIKEYDWKNAWLILGAICSHTFVSALLFRSNDAVQDHTETDEASLKAAEKRKIRVESKRPSDTCMSVVNEVIFVYKTKNFVLITLAYVVLSFAILTPHNFLPSHLELEKQKNPNMDDPTALAMSLIGISALAGQIIIGYVSDMFRSLNWLIFSVCLILSGFLTFIVPFLDHIFQVYVFSVLYGFLTSVNYVLQSTLVIESGMGINHLTMAFGCLQMTQGFSTLLGPPVLSAIKDQSSDYKQTFFVGGLLVSIAGVFLLGWPFFHKKPVSDEHDDCCDFNDDIKVTSNKHENMRLTVSTEVPI